MIHQWKETRLHKHMHVCKRCGIVRVAFKDLDSAAKNIIRNWHGNGKYGYVFSRKGLHDLRKKSCTGWSWIPYHRRCDTELYNAYR